MPKVYVTLEPFQTEYDVDRGSWKGVSTQLCFKKSDLTGSKEEYEVEVTDLEYELLKSHSILSEHWRGDGDNFPYAEKHIASDYSYAFLQGRKLALSNIRGEELLEKVVSLTLKLSELEDHSALKQIEYCRSHSVSILTKMIVAGIMSAEDTSKWMSNN